MSFKPYKPRDYATTKEVVTRMLDQAGGVKKAAHLLDRSSTQTVSYSDPATSDEISFDQVRRLIEATGATAPAEDLASLSGGVFLPCDAPKEAFDHLVARSAQEWGEFIACVVKAHADKKIDQIERRDMQRDLDDLIRTLVAARCRVNNKGES